jgi:glutathione reductase (NADPH)
MSSVGLTEAQAAAQGLDVTVAVNDMTDWFSGKTYAESVAWVKTLVERGSGRVVGAHMVGHQGEDLIHLFAMSMKHGITAAQIKDQLFAFPTFSADLKSMI